MLRIRTTKTGSGKTAVQVVMSGSHQVKLVKHIGSATTSGEIQRLKELAGNYLASQCKYPPLLPEVFTDSSHYHLVAVENLVVNHTYHQFAYDILDSWYEANGFGQVDNYIFKDLVIARIAEPVSKLQTIILLGKYFNKHYSKNKIYGCLKQFGELKLQAENIALNYAKSHFPQTLNLVFYDVTTMYFETFAEDDFRKCGFSKDGKANQPQILIGLVVNREGYPIAYEIFEGNTFEGKTFTPAILALKRRCNIDNLTIVADAAMLSFDNMQELEKHGLFYIVGARVANLTNQLITAISSFLAKEEGRYFTTQTQHGTLICDYSCARAAKDKSDRKKAISKAYDQIANPAKVFKRSRFLITSRLSISLNNKLIEKDELLDGIKGYYTNLTNLNGHLIVSRYKDLWHVEKSFRIAKSDLLARPIFHYKKESIKAHVLIVFVSLCVIKSIELATNLSIKKVKSLIWDILDIEFEDKLSGKTYLRRMKVPKDQNIKKLSNPS